MPLCKYLDITYVNLRKGEIIKTTLFKMILIISKKLTSNNSLNKTLKRKKLNFRKELIGWAFMLPMLFVLYFFLLRPQIVGISLSFFDLQGYTPVKFIGFDNYIRVVKDIDFLPTLINTFEYVFWSLIIGFPLPILIAFLLNEMVYFRNTLKVAIYLPAVVPMVVVMMLWKLMYQPDSLGLLNIMLSKLGLPPGMWLNNESMVIVYIIIASTWKGLGGAMLLYFASIQSIPLELYEAATIDGAGPIHKFIHISIPQVAGVILLNLVRQIISVFQILQEPMIMTGGGPNGASNSLGYLAYKYGFVTGRVGNSLALGTISFIILIFATIFYFRLNKKISENY